MNILKNFYSLIVVLFILSGCAQEENSTNTSVQESPAANAIENTSAGPVGTWDVRWESVSLTHSRPTPMYAELVINGSDGNYSAVFFSLNTAE